jgi:hypothetical protein
MASLRLTFQGPCPSTTRAEQNTAGLCVTESACSTQWRRGSFILDMHKLPAFGFNATSRFGDSAWQGLGWDI